jgi:hypothetical protein
MVDGKRFCHRTSHGINGGGIHGRTVNATGTDRCSATRVLVGCDERRR